VSHRTKLVSLTVLSASFAILVPALATAGDRRVACTVDGSREVRFVPKNCDDKFAYFARSSDATADLAGGMDGHAGVDVGVSTHVVQLDMDEINKELRTHYVAACEAASMSPCGPGMSDFIALTQSLPGLMATLRVTLASVTTQAQRDAVVDDVRAALAVHDANEAEVVRRVMAALATSKGIEGDWLVDVTWDAAHTTCDNEPSTSSSRIWHVATSDGQVRVSQDHNIPGTSGSGPFSVLEGTYDGTTMVIRGQEAPEGESGPIYRTALTMRIVPGDRLMGKAEVTYDGVDCMIAYSVSGTR
jgi:hypothetical protein